MGKKVRSTRSCEDFNYKLNLYSLAHTFSDARTVNHMEYVYNKVIENCKILDSCNDWAKLQNLLYQNEIACD